MSSDTSGIACGQCGKAITDEPSNDPTQRKPCPQCGSTTRSLVLHTAETISVSATVQIEVITYPQALLDVARKLTDNGQPSIAVVVIHMACEIATERSLSEAFAAKGLQSLEEAVEDMFSGYNLANPKIRKLYTALTGDDKIQKQTFWQKFKASAKRRNDIIHKGKIVEKVEAEESFKAAIDFIAHLKKLEFYQLSSGTQSGSAMLVGCLSLTNHHFP